MQTARPSLHHTWDGPILISRLRSLPMTQDQLPPHSPLVTIATSDQHRDELEEQLDVLAEEIDYPQEELDSFIDDLPIEQ